MGVKFIMIKSVKDLVFLERTKILGQGAFSKVLKVQSKVDNQIYALKSINKKNISQKDLQNMY